MPLDPARLPERGRAALAIFAQHPAATPAAVRTLGCPDDSINAVLKFCRRLTYRGWLETHRLPTGGIYYVPTRRAARALGLPTRRRRGLSQDGVIQHLGTLWLCLQEDIEKRSAADLRADCPELFRRGLGAGNYGVGADDRLLWLIIDHRARPARLARKAARAVSERERAVAFRELIDAGGFGVVVAVPTAPKAAEVEAALAPLSINRFAPVRVVVLPELGPLFLTGD